MTHTYTHSYTYTRTHAAKYITSNMQNVLRSIILDYGLDPDKLAGSWPTIGKALETWLISGHLKEITIEFYTYGSREAAARWDFPITYDGSGVSDDMWINPAQMRRIAAKSVRPPANATYRITLSADRGRPYVEGMGDVEHLSTAKLGSHHDAGPAVSTPSIMAGTRYWRS